MARILIVGGGCRGRRLAGQLVGEGQLLRITTRREDRRAAIESWGAECRIATPMRIGTLRPALEGVTLACWMLAGARGSEQELRALHGSRLELFLRQLVDTTVRGFVYDASPGLLPGALLAEGQRSVRAVTERNAIPARLLSHSDGADDAGWIGAARDAVGALLVGRRSG